MPTVHTQEISPCTERFVGRGTINYEYFLPSFIITTISVPTHAINSQISCALLRTALDTKYTTVII
jgi:hypothetical protein